MSTTAATTTATTLSSLLDSFSSNGKEFELLVKWYLENDPSYAGTIKQVWLWDDWSGRWGRDCGIDLIAETIYGTTWAIQAKCYDEKYPVTKADIDSFLSESNRPEISYRLLVTTTNLLGVNAERTLQGQEKPCGIIRREDLERSLVNFDGFLTESQYEVRPDVQELRPHQDEALTDILKGFNKFTRGQYISACGTGKSLVAVRLSETVNTTLVLVPSISLLKQTRSYWLANSRFEIETLCVCSDDTVADDVKVIDLGVPVTTNTTEIRRFLASSETRKVVFSTYQSSPRLAAEDIRFDLAIADEAHRCAGGRQSIFNTILDENRINADRRLFMTATPRYVEGATALSMDDSTLFGPVFHALSFGQAIRKGLLCDYEVIVSVIREPLYQEWVDQGRFVTYDGATQTDARTLAAQITLAQTMRNLNLRKVVTFHNRVKSAKHFAETLPDVVSWLPEQMAPTGAFQCNYVHGGTSAGERSKKLKSFVAHQGSAVMSNVKVLAEGVDVPSIDTVAFVDPKGSMVEIVQAVGRAIRLSPDKTIGRVFVAAVVPEDVAPEEALQDGAFSVVRDVLMALRAHDETLAERLTLGTGRGTQNGVGRPRILDRVLVVGAEPITQAFALAFEAMVLNDPAITHLVPTAITYQLPEPTAEERISAHLRSQSRDLVRLLNALGSTVETDTDYLDRLTRLTASIDRTWGHNIIETTATLDLPLIKARGEVIKMKLRRYGIEE